MMRILLWIQINYDKTVLYRVDTKNVNNAKIFTNKEVQWNNQSTNILGIEVLRDTNKLLEVNYQGIITKIEAILTNWKKRIYH